MRLGFERWSFVIRSVRPCPWLASKARMKTTTSRSGSSNTVRRENWRQNIEQNDTQLKDTRQNRVSWFSFCYRECYSLYPLMVIVTLLNIIFLNVILLSVILSSFILLSVILLFVLQPDFILLGVILLSVILLSVILLSVVLLNVIQINVIFSLSFFWVAYCWVPFWYMSLC